MGYGARALIADAERAFHHEQDARERDLERELREEEELLAHLAADGIPANLVDPSFRPITSQRELEQHARSGERYRLALAEIYRYVDELEMQLGEEHRHEPVDHMRPKHEQLLASEVIAGVKARIARMYIGGAS